MSRSWECFSMPRQIVKGTHGLIIGCQRGAWPSALCSGHEERILAHAARIAAYEAADREKQRAFDLACDAEERRVKRKAYLKLYCKEYYQKRKPTYA